jgi:hypothetical protein
MTRTLTFAALLLAASCSQPDQQAAPTNEADEAAATAQAPASEASVPALEGQWTVTAIDGAPIGAASAMTASFAAGKAIISSGCLRRGWTYTQKRNVVSFANDPGSSANCGGGPSGDQESAYIALEQSSIAIFNKDGKEATLSGTGGNLTLKRR